MNAHDVLTTNLAKAHERVAELYTHVVDSATNSNSPYDRTETSIAHRRAQTYVKQLELFLSTPSFLDTINKRLAIGKSFPACP